MNENPHPSPAFDPQEPERRGRSVRIASIVCVIAILIVGLGVRGWWLHRTAAGGGDMTCDVPQQYENIRIQAVSCDVDISVGANDTTSVQYCGPSRMACTAEVKNGTLVIVEKSARRWPFFMNLFGLQDAKLTVYLPEREIRALSVETVSGDIEVPKGGAFRTVEFTTVSGEIELTRTEDCDVTAETVSGDVDIRSGSLRGLYVSTTSGALSVENVSVEGSAELGSVSGDVAVLSSDAESLIISAISGDVHTALRTPMEYVTDTTSGEVTVTASQTGAGRCSITTVSGDILCE